MLTSTSELEGLGVGWCDYIDLSMAWIEDADWPKEWTCPECGGTDFEGVSRDYQASGLKGAAFTVDVEESDENE